MAINWDEVTSLSAALSALVLAITAILILVQLRRDDETTFVDSTSQLFRVWSADDFQQALQWVLYDLDVDTWEDFLRRYANKYGERAFIRVGSYFNRVGYLTTNHLLGANDRILLDTISGPAIASWQKMEPLVLEARLVQNATLFQDFERMLPRCYECYVPTSPIPHRIRVGAAEAQRLGSVETRDGQK
jgi:hypothetical protein